jgi:hypothetical protein
MRALAYGAVGLVAAALVFPAAGAAQAPDGWWSWALRDVAADASTDRIRGAALPGEGGLLDVILGRADSERLEGRTKKRDGGYKGDRSPYPEVLRDAQRDRARQGPPFCRNGRGHPVHGRQWCRDKGFGVRTAAADRGWVDGGWRDVVFGRRAEAKRRTVDRGGLLDILGDVVVGRLEQERRRGGGREPLEGRWLDLDGARVLQVRSGGVAVAELTDLDGDRRADVVLVPRR